MALEDSRDVDGFVLVADSDTEESTGLGEKAEVVTKIRSWLNPTDFNADTSEYRKHLNAHVDGTGQWVLETGQYRNWHDTDTIGDLWIRGIPGSGKSVVAANLIRLLRDNEEAPVLFFFFRQIITSNQSPKAFLRDASFQLLDHSPGLQTSLKELRERYSDIDSVPFDDLFQAFASALSLMEKVYCVLDALDEMNLGEDAFLRDLLNLGRRYPKSIKLAMTSRQLPYLEAHFKGSCLVDLRLDRINVDNDIAKYVTYRLDKAQACIPADEAESVKTAVCQRGKGLFLYARMMMDECIRDPKRFMSQALPDGLGDMYTTLLSEHALRSGTGQDFQKTVLGWVTHARRPLRLTELTAIINSMTDRAGLANGLDTKQSVRRCCGPLLEVCEDEVVQIIHHSFTEFLLGLNVSHVQMTEQSGTRFPVLDPSSTHADLAITCIRYLQSGCFNEERLFTRCKYSTGEDTESEDSDSDADDYCYHSHESWPRGRYSDSKRLSRDFSFIQYACCWYIHAVKGQKDPRLLQMLDQFMISDNHDFESWKDCWSDFDGHVPEDLSPVHVAARCGLDVYIRHLLERGSESDKPDAFGRTPMMYAAMEGHSSVVATLLEHQVNYESVDTFGFSPLHHAARRGHAETMKVLLAAGANPLARNIKDLPKHVNPQKTHLVRPTRSHQGRTALYYVCTAGQNRALEQLLNYTPDEKVDREAIFWAIEAGKCEVLKLLLSRRPDVNAVDENGNTPLFYAAKFMLPEAALSLIRAGADPNLASMGLRPYENPLLSPIASSRRSKVAPPYTPLHGWAHLDVPTSSRNKCTERDMLETLDALINAGAKINAVTHDGRTALHSWKSFATDRSDLVVSWLLERGADPLAVDHAGNSVLFLDTCHVPVPASQRAAISRLIDAGADINHQSRSTGQTPLIRLSDCHGFSDASFFNSLNAAFNVQDKYGNTALHYACKSFFFAGSHIDEWLRYSDPTLRNNAGILPAANLAWGENGQDRVKAIEKMVERGLDIESRDYRQRTLLLSFLDTDRPDGTEHFVRELLRLGANVQARDFKGKSGMYTHRFLVRWTEYRIALHLLVANDLAWVDMNKDDFELKHSLMKDFISAGCDPNAKDYNGNSIFHDTFACRMSWPKIRAAARCVVASGSDIHARNFQGRTALHVAACRREFALFNSRDNSEEMLLDFILDPEFAFNVNEEDNNGITPLHLAAETSEINVWKLIKAGAEVTKEDMFGRNALHYAARSGKCNIIDLLISVYKEHDWSLDVQSLTGRSALHEAAKSGKVEAVNSLLAAGAKFELLDASSRSPLHAAAEYEQVTPARLIQRNRSDEGLANDCFKFRQSPRARTSNHSSRYRAQADQRSIIQIRQVVKTLLAAGSDPAALDTDNHTPSDVALMYGNHAVVQELASVMKSVYHETLKPAYAFEEALSVSFQGNLPTIFDQFKFENDLDSQLRRIIASGDENVAELLRHHPTPLVKDDGLSILHLVVRSGMVSLLNELRPSVEEVNKCMPPLLFAAAEREETNLAMVKALVDAGADVNYVYKRKGYSNKSYSSTIAHTFASGHFYWYPVALAVILEAGAVIETEDESARTCLHVAVSQRERTQSMYKRHETTGFWSDQTLDVLLKFGASSVNTISSSGFTPLNTALKSGRGRFLIEKLLENGADSAIGPVPPLASAIEKMDVLPVMLFLEAGSDPNVKYTIKRANRHEDDELRTETPLFKAAISASEALYNRNHNKPDICQNQQAIVDLLLEYGADPLQELMDGTSTVLHEVAEFNGLITPRFLDGIDLDVRDSQGMTALHRACKHSGLVPKGLQNKDAALVLIEHGADVNAKDNFGCTPLHYSVLHNLEDISSALVSQGACATARNEAGLSPLSAILDGATCGARWIPFKRWAIDLLLSAGADPFERGPREKTLLHYIATQLFKLGSKDGLDQPRHYADNNDPAELALLNGLYRRLIALGCDLEARDSEGNTPIFDYVGAVKHTSPHVTGSPPEEKELREMFPMHDIFAINNKGEGLLHVVARKPGDWAGRPRAGVSELFKALVSLGLDPRKEDGRGWTALDVAAAHENKSILDLYARKD